MRTERAFWDTSAVVPLCVARAPSSELRRVARLHRRLVVWWATPIEARSAIARLRREGTVSDSGAADARRRLEALRQDWSEVLPTEDVRDLASDLLDRHALRAGVAIQLAAALVSSDGRPRRRPFLCLDDPLAAAAGSEGFHVLRPGA